MKKVLDLFTVSKLTRLSILVGSGAFLLYIVNRLYFKKVFDWTFIHNYLNDVLAGILIVAIVNVIAIVGNQRRLVLRSYVRILLFTLFCGGFWEYITPLYLAYSVSDSWDIVAYMFGGVLYWIILQFASIEV